MDSIQNRAGRSPSFLKNLAFSSTEYIFLLASRLAVGICIARFLGPQGQGVYALALTTALIATMPFWGLELGNNYLGNRHHSEFQALFGNTLLVFGGAAAIVIPLLWLS